jgi:Domain of unknown function (DUF5668)
VSLPPRRNYRSFFWPVVLILAGILALLVNAGVISTDRLSLLEDLWPVILIVIGLELLARRALNGTAGEVAAVLIVLIAAGGAIAYVALAPSPGATHALESVEKVGTLDHASLEVDVGSAQITIDGAAGDGELYRAHIEYSGSKPDINLDRSTGKLQISQDNNSFGVFRSRNFVLDIHLNPSLPWSIVGNSGAATDTFKLADINVRSIELNTGASREEITLGKPSGIVPITVNGGALTVHLHRPVGTAASVNVSGGAVNLDADGQQHRGIGNQNWQSAGYSGARDAYRVEINGGACTVGIDTSGSSA